MAFTAHPPNLGPGPLDPCPCQSGLPPTDCHASVARGGWILPKFTPLLSGPRTGVAVQGCYAAAACDCEGSLTDEHWLSEGVLREASDDDDEPLRLLGLSWANGAEVKLYPPSVVKKVLCERHNQALSPLDATARRIFGALRRYQRDLIADDGPGPSEFILSSGEHLERWLLKLLWGASAAGVVSSQAGPVTALSDDVDERALADFLYRDGARIDAWECYAVGGLDGPVRAAAEIAVSMQTDSSNNLVFGTANMGVVTFGFAFRPTQAGPAHELRRHPSAVCLTDESQRIQKVVALAWDGPPGRPCVLNLVGRVNLG